MKGSSRARALLAAIAAASIPTGLCRAGTTWDGGGSDNDWSTNNNWNPNGKPANDGTAAIVFTGATRPGPNLDTNWSISSLTFNAAAGAFTLGSTTASTLTIGNVGLLNASMHSQTINHAIKLNAAQTWTVNGGSGLTVNGAINTNGHTLTAIASDLMDFNGAISGSGGFTKNGTDTVSFIGSGANTYTGDTVVTTGTLLLDKSTLQASIPGNLMVGNGSGSDVVLYENDFQFGPNGGTTTLNSAGLLNLNGHFDFFANLVFVGGELSTGSASGEIQLLGSLTSNATSPQADIDGSGVMTLFNSNKLFTIGDGEAAIDLNIDVPIGEGNGSDIKVFKAGAGTLRLGKANTFTGGLQLNAGTLILDNNTAPGPTTSIFTLAGGTLESQTGASLGHVIDVTGDATVLASTSLQLITFSSIVMGSGNLTIDSPDDTATVLALTGASFNSLSGTVTVNQGVLKLNKFATVDAIAGPLVVGDGSGAARTAKVWQAASNQINNASAVTVKRDGFWFAAPASSETIASLTMEGGGEIDLDTGLLTLNGDVSVTAGSGAPALIDSPLNLGGARTVDVGSGAVLDLVGNVTGGSIIKTGAGSLKFSSSSNSFAGGLTINAGTVFVNANGTPLGTGSINFPNGTISPAGASRSLGNSIVLSGPATVDCSAFDLSFTGQIVGTGTLSKIGTSLLRLSNSANTYSGATTVFAGTLSVGNNGLGSAAGGTSVAIGATLQLTASYANAEPLTITSAGSPDGGGGALVANMPAGSGSFAGTITNSLNATIASIGGDFTLRGNVNTNTSPVTITGSGNTIVAALITGNGSLFKSGSATLTLTSANTYTGSTVVSGGRLLIQNNLTASSSVSVTAGTVELATGGGHNRVIHTGFLSVTGTGRIDLQDNKLITTSAIGTLGSGNTYTGVTGLIQSGRNGGGWNGTRGIVTSQTDATSSNFTTLGIATGAEAKAIASTATSVWAGQTVFGSDTLVMYTYGGDANLDGKINVDDYGRIDFNINLGTSGWFNGDFNYDGKINVDDYGIIDFNVGIQGTPFSTASSPLVAVPEPSFMMGLAILASWPCLPRRRRARKFA